MHSMTKLCLFKLTLGRKSQEADGLSHSHGTKRSLQGSCGDDQRALKNSEETLEISSKAIWKACQLNTKAYRVWSSTTCVAKHLRF